MFVRALLSREFLISAAVIIACGGYFAYQLVYYHSELELLRSPQNLVSLTHDNLDETSFDGKAIAAVKDFAFYGKPFSEDGATYQPLSAKSNDVESTSDPVVIALSSNLDGDALRKMITDSKGGCLRVAHEADDDAPAEDALVHPDYPDINLTGMKEIGYKDLFLFSKIVPLFGCIVGAHVLMIFLALYFQIGAMKKTEEWRVKLENFDPKVLGQYSHALRLCGTESAGLCNRRVDPDFDVPKKAKSQRPKLKRWSWKIGALLVISVLGAAVQWGTSYGLGDLLDNSWAQLAIGFLVMMAVNLAILKARGVKVGGVLEESVTPGTGWAKYQELPFFKYHDHVLKSLGMIELGAFRQTGGHVCMVRTIYLSPNGNVLVEVGVESREFFTIESVVNSGKFLETHSMVTPKHVKSALTHRHQRRSASHEDLLRALEEHDHLVGEFAGSGFREAKLDAEKFPRFLEWGGETNAI